MTTTQVDLKKLSAELDDELTDLAADLRAGVKVDAKKFIAELRKKYEACAEFDDAETLVYNLVDDYS